MPLHILKLCVGADSIADLRDWQDQRTAERRARGEDPRPAHVTRMWPKRAEEVLAGGSLYWVIRGLTTCRQRILALEPVAGGDGISRCALRLDPAIVPVRPVPRRPFQGWRYLEDGQAPADLDAAEPLALPPALARDLAALGVL